MLISEYFSCVNYNPLSPEGRAVPTTNPPSNFSFRRHNFNSVCQLLRDFFFSVGELTRGKGNQYLSVLSWQASPWGERRGRRPGGGKKTGNRKCYTALLPPPRPNRKTLPLPGKFATSPPCISECRFFVQFSLPG